MLYDCDEPSDFTVDDLLKLAKGLTEIEGDEALDKKEAFKIFISSALNRFYSPLFDNTIFTAQVGDALYRLSDHLTPDERRSTLIYPETDGDILDERGTRWASLEQWRREWEELRPEGIAFLAPELAGQFRAITAA